jgi:hypothetical protein
MTPTPEIDDTLLTAFALGELDMDPDERERVAAHVAHDADAHRLVEEVRESAGLVVGALEMELVDGLAEFQHEMIERRLSELHGEPEPMRFRPATLRTGAEGGSHATVLARGARFRRWLPTLASAAASILIVAGTLAFFLRFNRYDVVAINNPAGSPSAGPAATRSFTPPPVANATAEQDETEVEPDLVATNDEGPIEGMVDPKSVPTAKRVKKARAKTPAATAVASAKKPAPAAAAPAVTPKPKTMRLPDAIEMKRTSVASALIPAKPGAGAKGPKTTVSASAVRDAQALDKSAKTGSAKEPAVPSTPKLFENPFHPVAEQPRSSFRVPPYDLSYKRIKRSLEDKKQLPPASNARVEELLNPFTYSYPAPTDNLAVAVSVEVATCPWDISRRLARIALKARDARPGEGDKPVASNLTTEVQFNAAATNAWRLIGYESGDPAPGGTFPAADLAAGRGVTALYVIEPVTGAVPSSSTPSDLFTVSVRYRDTAGGQRETIKAVASDTGVGFDRASNDFRFASAVAAFGILLRDSTFAGKANYPDVIRWASEGKGADESRQREEFIELAKKARNPR